MFELPTTLSGLRDYPLDAGMARQMGWPWDGKNSDRTARKFGKVRGLLLERQA
jgi:hypothetical protein